MTGEKKALIAIAIVTFLILVGGVFALVRSSSPKSGEMVDVKRLIRDDSEKISSESATVTLVEFADYQCPACGSYAPVVKQLLGEFSGKLNLVYRNFPLLKHKNARIAAFAAEAAGEQGKFWEMHGKLFGAQAQWSKTGNAKEVFIGYAQQLGLDADRFKQDIDSDRVRQKIDRDFGDGSVLGVNATPTFYLQGKKLRNPSSYEDFKTLVQAALLTVPISQAPEEKYHVHANIAVVLNGEKLDFRQEKYQSTEAKELDLNIHLHDGNGDLIHIHKQGATLGESFTSLGMSLSADCLILDSGEKFCNDGNNTLKMYVNGKPDSRFGDLLPQDLDRILLSYGRDSEETVERQIGSVADTACIYSLTCPERGEPPAETCVGGLGSDCD